VTTPQIEPSILGYVVLTAQPDGSWKDDWNGEVWLTIEDGMAALSISKESVGIDFARLCALTDVTP
jgi:hypothetical protein